MIVMCKPLQVCIFQTIRTVYSLAAYVMTDNRIDYNAVSNLSPFIELMVFEQRRDMSFVTTGFSNWNDGRRRLERHQKSASHIESVAALMGHSTQPVDELLDDNTKQSKKDGHDMLWYVIEAMRILCRQGLSLRGCTNSDSNAPLEPDSNLWQQLQFLSRASERLKYLMSRTHTYTAPAVQNELMQIMSLGIQKELVEMIKKAPFYTLMLDETPDVGGQEQLVICFR